MSEKKPNYFVALDTETGSLYADKADLLTAFFAIVDMDFNIIDELNLKLKPDGGRLPIAEAGALKVNKIDIIKHMEDPETVTYSEGKKKLLEFTKKYFHKQGRHSNLIPLAFNYPFDYGWLTHHMISSQEWESTFNYNVEDAKACANFLKRCGWLDPETGSLESVVNYFGIPRVNEHQARGDVLMTIKVYKALVDLMKSKKDGGSTVDLISLLEAE